MNTSSKQQPAEAARALLDALQHARQCCMLVVAAAQWLE
jgi:hypothetical protein